jgi:AcrR family transcriptional regulator
VARASSERAARIVQSDASEARDTRLLLIEAAERLFAEQGLSRTSLRQINQEAGQRNESAIHYHFGSREAVILAIFELRTRPINEERLRMLADARAEAAPAALGSRALAEVLVLPLARAISASHGRTHYLRFLTQLLLDRTGRQRGADNPHDASVAQCIREFERSKPYYPAPIRRQRFAAAFRLAVQMLAFIEETAQASKGRSDSDPGGRARIANIVDMVIGILDAPISPDALLALDAPKRDQT